MPFDPSSKVQELSDRLNNFMEKHIYHSGCRPVCENQVVGKHTMHVATSNARRVIASRQNTAVVYVVQLIPFREIGKPE